MGISKSMKRGIQGTSRLGEGGGSFTCRKWVQDGGILISVIKMLMPYLKGGETFGF